MANNIPFQDAAAAAAGNATAGNQSTQITLETAIRDRLPATPHSQPLTDTQLRSTPVESISFIANPSANFTRPADTNAYAIGDLIANSTTAGSVVPMSFTVARVAAGSFMVRKVKITCSNTGALNAQIRIHLYRASPTCANGDNGAFSTSGVADYLGAMDITLDCAFTDGVAGFGVPLVGYDKSAKLTSGQVIYGLLEARTAYTPASGATYTAVLDVLQN